MASKACLLGGAGLGVGEVDFVAFQVLDLVALLVAADELACASHDRANWLRVGQHSITAQAVRSSV
jgi:hypothetical protein